MSNENQALWYVVHTYSGYENKVVENIQRLVEYRSLQDLIFETKIPTEIVVDTQEEADDYVDSFEPEYDDDGNEVVKAPKEAKPKEHKLFPSYVLVKMIMNDDTWHVIRNIRGVTGFVGPGSKPVPLTEAEVEALGVDVRVRKTEIAVGDRVMIVSGLFVGAEAVVNEIDEASGKIKVTAVVNGREANIELGIKEVEPEKA